MCKIKSSIDLDKFVKEEIDLIQCNEVHEDTIERDQERSRRTKFL